MRSGSVTASNDATVAENKPVYGLQLRIQQQRGDMRGSQKPRSRLHFVGGSLHRYCPLPEQSWNTWHGEAMSYHGSRFLPRMMDRVLLVIEAGGDSHRYLPCIFVKISKVRSKLYVSTAHNTPTTFPLSRSWELDWVVEDMLPDTK